MRDSPLPAYCPSSDRAWLFSITIAEFRRSSLIEFRLCIVISISFTSGLILIISMKGIPLFAMVAITGRLEARRESTSSLKRVEKHSILPISSIMTRFGSFSSRDISSRKHSNPSRSIPYFPTEPGFGYQYGQEYVSSLNS